MDTRSAIAVALAFAVGGLLPLRSAHADGDTAASAQSFVQSCRCAQVADSVLAGVRGGFDDGQGLTASIGLERLTVVNGVVVSTISVHISDLSRITAQQARQLQTTLGALGILNGSGNLNAALQGASAGTTVIQNTLNDQTIRNTSILNISTNSQQLLKAANLQSTLQDALNQGLGGR